MSDKLRKTFPLNITFSDGEQPTASKLNAVSSQARNGLSLIEKAIGDLWGQSGDGRLDSYPLKIPNLGRVIGELKYLNPPFCLPSTGTFTWRENLFISHPNKTFGFLRFKPTASTLVVDSDTGSSFSTLVSATSVLTNGDYSIDYTTGKWTCAKPIQSALTIRYTVSASELYFGDTGPSIVPDPRQPNYTGIKFYSSGGLFYIQLPPKLSLTFSDTRERPDWYPTVAGEVVLNTGITNSYFFPDISSGSANTVAEHRYHVGGPVGAIWSSLAVNTRIPDGYMYIWDETNKTILEDIVFYKGSDTYTYRITSASIDLTTFSQSVVSSPNLESKFNSALNGRRYTLLIPGVSITKSLYQLQNAYYSHSHTALTSSSPLSHSSLDNLNPLTSAVSVGSLSSLYPTYLPAWRPSKWWGDDHVSLLSRGGSQYGGTRSRDANNNAMIGHLVLANSVIKSATTGSFLDATCPDGSFKLYFGDASSTAPYLRGKDSAIETATPFNVVTSNSIQSVYISNTSSGYGLDAYSSTGIGIRGTTSTGQYAIYGSNSGNTGAGGVLGICTSASATSGAGLVGVGWGAANGISATCSPGTGTALYVTGNATKSPIHIAPQAIPTPTATNGDILVNSVTGVLSNHTGRYWNQNGVLYNWVGNVSVSPGNTFAYNLSSAGTLLKYDVPANALKEGNLLKFYVGGKASAIGSSFWVLIGIAFGSGAEFGVLTTNSLNEYFVLEGSLIIGSGSTAATIGRNIGGTGNSAVHEAYSSYISALAISTGFTLAIGVNLASAATLYTFRVSIE